MIGIIGSPPFDRLLFEILCEMVLTHLAQYGVGTSCRSPIAHESVKEVQCFRRETLDLFDVGPEPEFHEIFRGQIGFR